MHLSTLVRFKTTETSNNYIYKSKILYAKAYYIIGYLTFSLFLPIRNWIVDLIHLRVISFLPSATTVRERIEPHHKSLSQSLIVVSHTTWNNDKSVGRPVSQIIPLLSLLVVYILYLEKLFATNLILKFSRFEKKEIALF